MKEKLIDIIENKKKQITSSLQLYLLEKHHSKFNAGILRLIADNEITICNELINDIKSMKE